MITTLQPARSTAVPACAVGATLPGSPDTVHAGELEIRLGEGLVLASGRALTLSVREFELLAAMARRIGAIITREELYASVWHGALRPGDRSVDVYVSKLRTKLEAVLPDRRFIHTPRASATASSRRPRAAPRAPPIRLSAPPRIRPTRPARRPPGAARPRAGSTASSRRA